MKIAITGGSGFIGSVLARNLKDAGHEIIIIDIRPSAAFPDDVILADVRDKEAMVKALEGVDAIYHLAAEHRDDVSPISLYQDVNVQGGQNVIDAAKAHDIKTIIFTSSVAVYPLEPEDTVNGANENHSPAPFNPYGQSKLDSEKTFESWAAEDESRSLVMLRLVATFGPGNRGNIYTLMKQIADGKFIMIGDGSNKKSIAYVENVAAFLQHGLSFGEGAHIYNYADKPDLNMREFVSSIRGAMGKSGVGIQMPYPVGLMGGAVFDVAAKVTGRKFPISIIRIKKFCADTIVNAGKAHASGFNAPYSLNEGLDVMMRTEFNASPATEKKAA